MTDARETIAEILRDGAHEYDTMGEGPSDVDVADAILAALSCADIAPKVKPLDVLKEHAAYYRQCEADAQNPSQRSIADFQARAVEAILSALVDDISPKPEWQPIETILQNGSWVTMVDLDENGLVRLAHTDMMIGGLGWYLNADPSIFTHWTPLAPALVTQGEE